MQHFPHIDDVYFCGDIHGDFAPLKRLIASKKPKAIFLLGDVEASRPLEEEIQSDVLYFIGGNHDAESKLNHDNLFLSAYKDRNLHGKVVEIDGVKIAGLGGVFSEDVWLPPSEPIHENLESWIEANQYTDKYFEAHKLKHAAGTIFYDDYLALSMEKADVLIVHDAPSCHPYGFEALDDLATMMGVKVVFHGDHHDSLDYSGDAEKMGFRTYGVGLCGVTSLSGKKILDGKLDRERFEQRMQKKLNQSLFQANKPAFR